MRKIQFRGKRKDDGEWVHGYYHVMNDDCKGAAIQVAGSEHPLSLRMVEVDPDTIGQLTGARDMNGIELYNDDCVLWTNRNNGESGKGLIRYNGMLCRFEVEYNGVGYKINPIMFNYEVIGNRFDNPEMLKP